MSRSKKAGGIKLTSHRLVLLGLVSVLVLATVPASSHAIILSPVATVIPTLDGNITAGEWEFDADYETIFDIKWITVYAKHDNNWTYIAVDMINDTAHSNSDRCNLFFDTLGDGGLNPQTDDYHFSLQPTSSTAFHGNGASWGGGSAPSTPADWIGAYSMASGNAQFEFKINHTFVNGGNIINGVSGFAMEARDVNEGYYMYYPDGWRDTQNASYGTVPDEFDILLTYIAEGGDGNGGAGQEAEEGFSFFTGLCFSPIFLIMYVLIFIFIITRPKRGRRR